MPIVTRLILLPNVISLILFRGSIVKSNARILNSTCLFIVRAARFPANAFTLLELVISIAITVSVLFAAATIAVSELRSSIKLYVYQSLRDQAARVTFLIEAEVSEASSFLATEPVACQDARNQLNNTAFLFALRHSYLQGPSFTGATRANPPAASNICYFNRIVNNDNANPVFDLYRFSPPFDLGTGVLSSNAAATTLISPGTRLINTNGVTGVNININAAYWLDFATCTNVMAIALVIESVYSMILASIRPIQRCGIILIPLQIFTPLVFFLFVFLVLLILVGAALRARLDFRGCFICLSLLVAYGFLRVGGQVRRRRSFLLECFR